MSETHLSWLVKNKSWDVSYSYNYNCENFGFFLIPRVPTPHHDEDKGVEPGEEVEETRKIDKVSQPAGSLTEAP